MKKTVIITGASRGIGKACAILFSMNGYNVAINYNKSDKLAKDLVEDIRLNGGSAIAYKADVSCLNAVKEMTEKVYDDFGKIDVLVNNAGISLQGLFTDITVDQWEKLRSVDLDSQIYCCSAVLPYMIKNKKGKIINISSVWGVYGASCEVHYSAVKSAIIGLTKSLSKEYAPSGINVNCVAPGAIDTDMIKTFNQSEIESIIKRTPMGRLGSVTDVANAVLFLASNKSDFITGQVIGIDGGFC